jgi:putative inorganic carbon (HCO3(-)) transporter
LAGAWWFAAVRAAVPLAARPTSWSAAYLAAGVAAVIAGAVNVPLSAAAGKLLPASSAALVRSTLSTARVGGVAVNPNALGGTVLMFLPLAITLTVVGWREWTRRRGAPGLVLRTLAAPAAAGALLAVLVLSESRAAWIGAGATLVMLAAFAVPRVGRLVSVGALAAGAVVLLSLVFLPRQGREAAAHAGVWLHAADRYEIWDRALLAAEDFPLTGIGLNTFRARVHAMYPLFSVPPGTDIAHAHNVFLQAVLDGGVGGLVAYLAMLGVTAAMCWRVWRTGDDRSRPIALGLLGNLLAVHAFGVVDAIPLGTKVGLFIWWNLALVDALHRLAARRPAAPAAG